MAINPVKPNGPNLPAGIRSPQEVVDILASLRVDGSPVITDDNIHLDPRAKAQHVVQFFNQNFNVAPKDLPRLASLIKQDLKSGKLGWEA
jgi:hypothetical protein